MSNLKSPHGFSSLTQASPMTHVHPKSERSPSPSAAVFNRTVASRSARQPRLSFSSLAPSSEHDRPKKLNEEEEAEKSWNLRPRKDCGGGGAPEVKNQKLIGVMEPPRSTRQRGILAESPGVEVKNENPRLWVALSRDEIEQDVFSMSGIKPTRRPQKRTKTLQKHLDVISPGLCLVGLNADCFRVSISAAKGR